MEIRKTLNGTELTIKVEGRLDTMTAPALETELRRSLNGITDLTLDFTNLEYISSAGLRVLLWRSLRSPVSAIFLQSNKQQEGRSIASI